MNLQAISIEIAVALTGLALLLIDLWTPVQHRKNLGYVAALALGLILAATFALPSRGTQLYFNNTFVLDPMALFFKRFFLLAAIFVLLMSVDFADRILVGITEFYALLLFALTGMLLSASANDFVMLFVSLELITVTFYVLTSYQRTKVKSLEAGMKYLILGALSTGLTVFGIALIFGTAQSTTFSDLALNPMILQSPLFLLGMFMVVGALCFKIAAFPFQIWAPDVYEGSPAPVTAFLAIGSKAAGFVLLLRILTGAVPGLAENWSTLLVTLTIVTMLYGNLCALPQRNLKRLLGYSSIANAGYLLLGVTAASAAGTSAILYYFLGYLFSVIAAFFVISIITRQGESEDISVVAGLHHRSPILASTLALAMISLAGIPPLAGFFGKFLLLKSVIERGTSTPLFWVLIGAALFAIVASFYYYLGVVRAIYWSKEAKDYSAIKVSTPVRVALYACIAGMLFLGIFPGKPLKAAERAAAAPKTGLSPTVAMQPTAVSLSAQR